MTTTLCIDDLRDGYHLDAACYIIGIAYAYTIYDDKKMIFFFYTIYIYTSVPLYKWFHTHICKINPRTKKNKQTAKN